MKSNSKWKVAYSGHLKLHWQWSVVLALTLLALDVVLLCQDRKAGITAFAFTAGYFVLILLFARYFKPRILRDLVDFATKYGQVQKEILKEFDIPTALMEPDGKILWMNDNMAFLTEKNARWRKNISALFPQVEEDLLPIDGWEKDVEFTYKESDYRAHIQRISLEELVESAQLIEKKDGANFLYMIYLYDETQLHRLEKENREQKSVVGLVYIDNYDDVMDRTDEVHQSLLTVLVERKISKYFATVNGLVKKLEKDKYLVLMNRKGLDALCEDRFSILEGVKTINIGNELSMTASIGMGVSGTNDQQNYEYARSAMEMSLGRGGDQAVIKEEDSMSFYGGKTQSGEKNTRVKARVKAQALRELILSKDEVVAMGHSFTDMDSFGAAVGICRAAMTVGKPAHIVLGDQDTNIRGWVQLFRESREYPDDFFITHEQAKQMVTNSVALVIVDTNRPSRTECPELLKLTSSIVVLDHHRQTTETVEKAALSYIETSASSACEMVAEILQYFEDGVKLRGLEADCIYGGIIIDTNSFATKAGVRTFEAAAYLRRSGADVTRVRKALRENIDSYMARMECVSHAEKFMDAYAISICDGAGLDNPSVVGAQAANELLNIDGVKASFVVATVDKRMFISARSIDEVNVQLVMERLGGGGHLNIAGAQLQDTTPEGAVEKVKEVLEAMTKEGVI